MAAVYAFRLIRRVFELVFPVAGQSEQTRGDSAGADEKAMSRLMQHLPMKLPLCGRAVTLRVGSTGSIQIETGDYEGLKPRAVNLAGRRLKATASEINEFILFLLQQPIGSQWLCFGKEYFVNERRCEILALGLDAWRSMKAPLSKRGHLMKSMRCCAYVQDEVFPKVCANATKDPSGLCHHHRGNGTLTIWNHDPFSLQDDMHRRIDRIIDG